MSKIWTREGVRFAIEGGALVVYIDADKLADVDGIDLPEVELLRVTPAQVLAEVKRAAKNVVAEFGRLKKRAKK